MCTHETTNFSACGHSSITTHLRLCKTAIRGDASNTSHDGTSHPCPEAQQCHDTMSVDGYCGQCQVSNCVVNEAGRLEFVGSLGDMKEAVRAVRGTKEVREEYVWI